MSFVAELGRHAVVNSPKLLKGQHVIVRRLADVYVESSTHARTTRAMFLFVGREDGGERRERRRKRKRKRREEGEQEGRVEPRGTPGPDEHLPRRAGSVLTLSSAGRLLQYATFIGHFLQADYGGSQCVEQSNHAGTATSVAPCSSTTCQPGTLRIVMWRC